MLTLSAKRNKKVWSRQSGKMTEIFNEKRCEETVRILTEVKDNGFLKQLDGSQEPWSYFDENI